MQCLRSVYKNPNTKRFYAIKITKQRFDHFPMVFKRRVHKLGEFVHDKRDIWPNNPEMLEATNHPMVNGGIDRRITIISNLGSTHDKPCGDRFRAENVIFAQKINDILLLK